MTAGNAKYASDQWLEKSTRNPQRLTPAFRQRDRLDWVGTVSRSEPTDSRCCGYSGHREKCRSRPEAVVASPPPSSSLEHNIVGCRFRTSKGGWA